MFGFEKLEVWQKAIELTDSVYAFTRPFPADERFGLTSQMRRASVSVAANIAEGSARGSAPDFTRFIEFSYSSLMELVTETTVAQRQGFLPQANFSETYDQCERIARMLSGLRSSLVKSEN
ncbi:MAG: four helix bundle protein [Pirellulales bacterium]